MTNIYKRVWEKISVKQGTLVMYHSVFVGKRVDKRSRRNIDFITNDNELAWTIQDPPSEWEDVYFVGITVADDGIYATTVNGEVFKINMGTGEVYFAGVTK